MNSFIFVIRVKAHKNLNNFVATRLTAEDN